MLKMDKSSMGGANSSHTPADQKDEKYKDAVGINAGESCPGGTADGKGTDRGHHLVRQASDRNPQNTHEVIQGEYTRDVRYGGKTDFGDVEP